MGTFAVVLIILLSLSNLVLAGLLYLRTAQVRGLKDFIEWQRKATLGGFKESGERKPGFSGIDYGYLPSRKEGE